MTSRFEVPHRSKQVVIFTPDFALVFSLTLLKDDISLGKLETATFFAHSFSLCFSEGGLRSHLRPVTGRSGDFGGERRVAQGHGALGRHSGHRRGLQDQRQRPRGLLDRGVQLRSVGVLQDFAFQTMLRIHAEGTNESCLSYLSHK